MKKMNLTILITLLTLRLFAPEYRSSIIVQRDAIAPFEKIWRAVCAVESSGDANAYHMEDNGFPSIGIGQIQQSRLDDFNIKTGKNYYLYEMYDPIKAKEVFYFYCDNPYNLEKIARCWNAGPNGMSYKVTVKYWNKIKLLL
jgi:hypothetical protein